MLKSWLGDFLRQKGIPEKVRCDFAVDLTKAWVMVNKGMIDFSFFKTNKVLTGFRYFMSDVITTLLLSVTM